MRSGIASGNVAFKKVHTLILKNRVNLNRKKGFVNYFVWCSLYIRKMIFEEKGEKINGKFSDAVTVEDSEC